MRKIEALLSVMVLSLVPPVKACVWKRSHVGISSRFLTTTATTKTDFGSTAIGTATST